MRTRISEQEKSYYESLFTGDGLYSSRHPNMDEAIRLAAMLPMISFVSRSTQPLRILEVGCGRGWLTYFLDMFGTCIGTDPVPSVIEYAKGLYPGLDFRALGIEDVRDGPFDLVVASEVLEHVLDGDKGAFVRGLYELVAPSGYALITTPRAELRRYWEDASGQPTEDWLTEADLRTLFLRSGFTAAMFSRTFFPKEATVMSGQDAVLAIGSPAQRLIESSLGRSLGRRYWGRWLLAPLIHRASLYQVWLFQAHP